MQSTAVAEPPIVVNIFADGVAKTGEEGIISRVVGNCLAYANLPSGKAVAFCPADIESYAGQTLKSLGVRKGARVLVVPKSGVNPRIPVKVEPDWDNFRSPLFCGRDPAL